MCSAIEAPVCDRWCSLSSFQNDALCPVMRVRAKQDKCRVFFLQRQFVVWTAIRRNIDPFRSTVRCSSSNGRISMFNRLCTCFVTDNPALSRGDMWKRARQAGPKKPQHGIDTIAMEAPIARSRQVFVLHFGRSQFTPVNKIARRCFLLRNRSARWNQVNILAFIPP